MVEPLRTAVLNAKCANEAESDTEQDTVYYIFGDLS
jgi:hypothetical protein